MLMLYFSGTGNSKYVAETFSKHMKAKCHSIEEPLIFSDLIYSEKTIAFCYPIYGSRPPKIVRDFVIKHMKALQGKDIIIFCTQLLFSGDGARSFTDLFPNNYINVIYAEHFCMPNNMSNFSMLVQTDKKKLKKIMLKTERKVIAVCNNIKKGIVKKRGFNNVSMKLGLTQAIPMARMEESARKSLTINSDCTHCKLCIKICPTKNLQYKETIIHDNNCTLCYRCVNKCPQKAITVYIHKKIKKQYKGLPR